MPAYLVKVTLKQGWIRPPIVASCADEEEAITLIKNMTEDDDVIEVKGIRPDVMKAAFGDLPAGTAVFRHDWTWAEDGETPELY